MNDSKISVEFLTKSILNKYKFGFLGEAYISMHDIQENYSFLKPFLDKYFSKKVPFYCNRNKSYYSNDLTETMDLISSIESDAAVIHQSKLSRYIKEFFLFSLAEHMLSAIAKLLGVCFSYISLKDKYYKPLKTCLQQFTDYLVEILFIGDSYNFPLIPDGLLKSISTDMNSNDITVVREYSEMDNILVLFITYFVFSEYIKIHDVIISPLQGAALIPPFYISMEKYINNTNSKANLVDFDYIRFSQYDNTHYLQESLSEQIISLSKKYTPDTKILLIDDNVGTGVTLKTIKRELNNQFRNVTSCALEYRWDTKLYLGDEYPAFQLNDIDLTTPLCYRYFREIDEQISYIKIYKVLHSRYRNGNFNKLDMIYDEIDYPAYINENCTDEEAKARLLNIYKKFRHICGLFSVKLSPRR